jgi:hypothetical protein
MIIVTSALTMSTQWLIIAPRPKVAARLATVELCQIRAWCSRQTMPSARISLDSR